MSSADAFWLNLWQIIATIGFIVVIIGVVIEGVEHFKKFPKKEHTQKVRIEKIGWLLVVAGLAMEFLGDHVAKGISDRESARLINEAAQATALAKSLELQLWELSPDNRPAFEIAAYLILKVRGTNLHEFSSDPAWKSDKVGFVSIFKSPFAGWIASPIAVFDTENYEVSNSQGLIDEYDYKLRLTLNPLSVAKTDPNVLAKIIDAKNLLTIKLKFLPPNADVIEGSVRLIPNNSTDEIDFNIRPEKISEPFHGFSLMAISGTNGL